MSSYFANRVQRKKISPPPKMDRTEKVNMKVVVKNWRADTGTETTPIETSIENPRLICEYVHLTQKGEPNLPIFAREDIKVNQELLDKRSRSKSTSGASDSSDGASDSSDGSETWSRSRYNRKRRNSRKSSKDKSRRSKERTGRSSSRYRSRSQERSRRSTEKSASRTRDRSGIRHRYRKSSRSRSRHRKSPSYRSRSRDKKSRSRDRNSRSRDRKFRFRSRSRDRKSRSRDRSSRSRRSRSRSGGSYSRYRRRSLSRKRKRSITPLRPGEYRPGHPDLALREKRNQNASTNPGTATKPLPHTGFPMGPMPPMNYGYMGDPFMMRGFPPRMPMMPPTVYANYYRQMMGGPMMPRIPPYAARPRLPIPQQSTSPTISNDD